MKINKRECRKFADPGFKMNQNHGLLHAEKVKYIVRTAVKNTGIVYLSEGAGGSRDFPASLYYVPEQDRVCHFMPQRGWKHPLECGRLL